MQKIVVGSKPAGCGNRIANGVLLFFNLTYVSRGFSTFNALQLLFSGVFFLLTTVCLRTRSVTPGQFCIRSTMFRRGTVVGFVTLDAGASACTNTWTFAVFGG